jgi:hypothetical protein
MALSKTISMECAHETGVNANGIMGTASIETEAILLYGLELYRTQRRPIPASKDGLEAICGASSCIGAH